MSENHQRQAELYVANAKNILDRDIYAVGERYTDAQAVATIALTHAVLAVVDAINEAVAELPVSGR